MEHRAGAGTAPPLGQEHHEGASWQAGRVADGIIEYPAFVDTVAWVHLENGRILCARPRGKDIFYIPGGKREGPETDLQTLLREIAEELTVALLPDTVTHVGTYEAYQPHGHPGGAVVRMICYTAGYSGTLAASGEIDELAWFCYADRPQVPLVDQLLFDDLKATGELR
jgi:8-oxo-dGTP pyrophosphatase MutT (NUDIX family)